MPTDRPLRIAYLSDQSPLDPNLYSGGNARIHDALCRHAGEVTILPQTWGIAEPLRRALHRMPEHVTLRARWRMHYALAPVIAAGLRRPLAQGGFDVVFGAYALHALAGLRVPRGVVTAFTSDAVQTVYRTSEIGEAFRSSRIGRLSDAWVEGHETRALRRADVLIWPSEWLRKATMARYGLPGERGHVVPWGANLDRVPPPRTPLPLPPHGPLNLLFVGRDWTAKGGPVVLETVQRLRDSGIDARLTVIGCSPPLPQTPAHTPAPALPHITVHAQLDKSRPDQMALFDAAMARAHVMMMPSFESYGFAFCEASAHGVPALCLRVGGVPVRDGINGHALPPGSGPAEFAALLSGFLDDPAAYARLAASTRHEYETRLNWDTWGQTTAALLRDAVARKRSAPQR